MLKPCVAIGAVALFTSAALAQTSPPPAAPSPGATARPESGTARGTNTRGHTSEYRAAQAAKVTLTQAIEAAESKGQGRAVEVDFEVENNIPQYEVKVLGADGKLVEHHVDANTGQVIKSENHPIEGFFKRLKPADMQNARTSLKQAVALAEQKAGGRAVEAEVEHEANSVQYEITVANGDRTQKVKVDANGQIVSQN